MTELNNLLAQLPDIGEMLRRDAKIPADWQYTSISWMETKNFNRIFNGVAASEYRFLAISRRSAHSRGQVVYSPAARDIVVANLRAMAEELRSES